MYERTALGFGPFFAQQLQGDEEILARITSAHRGAYEAWSDSAVGPAQVSGHLRHVLDDLPAVGDWVVLGQQPGPDHVRLIERVLARRTLFTRGAAGRKARVQVIAANVDLVFVVSGLDEDFNVRRIERYLARVWASGAEPSIILNKADLCADADARAAEIATRCPHVPIHQTSALRAEGIAAVRARVSHGLTVALVGSSGAGKSTLVNALLGEDRLPTGAVRARDGRGRHVTTRRQLVVLPGGGLLLDTPGMRELQLVDDTGLDAVFTDVAALSNQCRFRDCRHGAEPGCAVRAAVESGDLGSDRLEHYLKLEREAESHERRQDEGLRRKSERVWGQLHDEIAHLRRWKGGKE